MHIADVKVHLLRNIPIEPPPFRSEPSKANAMLFEVRTSEGHQGWSMSNHGHTIMADLVNGPMRGALIGEDPLTPERLWRKLADPRPDAKFGHRRLGRAFQLAMSNLDVALWDIRGKVYGEPTHRLIGGAQDKVEVYITHGAAYSGAPVYSKEELAEEAAYLVDRGIRHLKTTVGRQMAGDRFRPDPVDDYERMRAIRESVGPDVGLSMDGNSRMRLGEASRLSRYVEELDIEFFEEPIFENQPQQLRELRQRTLIPIAVAENHKFDVRDYLGADAVDIVQPNVVHDGGYTGALKIAAHAEFAGLPIGHGNGAGPHNIALQAGLSNGTMVEYHFHKWMTYNRIFTEVPQPIDGHVAVSDSPGLGLDPDPDVLAHFAVN